jgi:type II restriction enzyme
LALPTTGLESYKSGSQRARVATEAWAGENVYCVNCDCPRLQPSAANTPAIDYSCPECDSPFQLKAQSHSFASRIVDAAYATMLRAVQENRTPNLLALHYEPDSWRVQNLILIPRFVFTRIALEKRKPLGPHARRAGWVGCNILLTNIPPDARISLVHDGEASDPNEVRQQYRRLRPLADMTIERRGWTLDVLNVVRSLKKSQFALADLYARQMDLARLHPANKHVRDKIRQQLQVLRDLGFVEFLGAGEYCLR